MSNSLAEFAARRRQKIKIIFSRDMCVRENTSQAASVEFCRCAAKLCAQQAVSLLPEKTGVFFGSLKSRREAVFLCPVALEGATLFLPVSIGVRSNHMSRGAVRPLLQEKEGLWTYMGISACPVWTRTRTGS